jgi:hypothetical protein
MIITVLFSAKTETENFCEGWQGTKKGTDVKQKSELHNQKSLKEKLWGKISILSDKRESQLFKRGES